MFATHFEKDLLHFPRCKEIKNEFSNVQFSPFWQNILDILKKFNGRFTDFQNLKTDILLYTNLLTVTVKDQNPDLQLELCNLQEDPLFLLKQDTQEDFFKLLPAEKYQKLRGFGLKMFSMFASTYICESSFSTMKLIKSNERNSLSEISLVSALRVATTELTIDIPEIIRDKERKYFVLDFCNAIKSE